MVVVVVVVGNGGGDTMVAPAIREPETTTTWGLILVLENFLGLRYSSAQSNRFLFIYIYIDRMS